MAKSLKEIYGMQNRVKNYPDTPSSKAPPGVDEARLRRELQKPSSHPTGHSRKK
jgi:hypothetical protein